MPQKPSKVEHEVYVFVDEFNEEHGFSPSLRDIQRHFNWSSVSTAANHVDNMVVKGLLRKIKNRARTLEVVPRDDSAQTGIISEADHLNWLRQKIAEYEKSPEAARNAEILKAALALLDQTDNT